MIVTLAPLQIRTPEQISNQCYCRLCHRISPRCLVFCCRRSRFVSSWVVSGLAITVGRRQGSQSVIPVAVAAVVPIAALGPS